MLERILFFVILLGVLVLIHELGHFLVAKACRVQVLKFSIGFGPELLAFNIGETRYAISAVPLGGFVRMAGEDDLIERWGGPDAPPIDPERVLNAKPRWQRASILIAGPLANLLLPLLLYTGAAYGDSQVIPAVVETVFPDSPAAEAGLQVGDRIIAIDGQPVSTFAEMSERVGPRAGETIKVELRRAGATQILEVPLRRATGQDELERKVERGRMGIASFRRRPLIAPRLTSGAVSEGGVASLDLVHEVGGEPVERFDDLVAALGAASIAPVELLIERREVVLHGVVHLELPRFVRVELAASPGPSTPTLADEVEYHVSVEPDELATGVVASTQEAARELLARDTPAQRGLGFAGSCLSAVLERSPAAQLGLRRGDCVLAVDGRGVYHWGALHEAFTASREDPHVAVVARGAHLRTLAFRLERREEKTPLRRGHDRYLFGAEPPRAFAAGGQDSVHRGPIEAALAGFERTASITVMTLVGLGLLATGELPFQSVGGPMMLFDLAGKTAERGIGYFLNIMGFISINLAILNLLPIPVLDGGHLLFILIETIIRRPLPDRVKEIAIMFGFGLLLLLMIAVFRNDIMRYWSDIAGVFK